MKTIKLGCADFTFPLLQHDKVLDLIVLLGLQGIDIGLFSGRSHLRPESEFISITHHAKKVRKQIADRGLVATDVYLQLSTDLSEFAINHPDAKVRTYARDSFLKLIDYTEELGADHITILPGMSFSDVPVTESLKRSYEELTWRVEKVAKTSLTLGIEAHIGSPFQHPEEVQVLMNSVPGLTLTLDYTHFIRNGYTQQEIDPLIRYASHFHARGARAGLLQTSMTENVIDYAMIVDQMNVTGYQGWIGLEYIWIDWEGCNNVDTISETIRLRDILTLALAK